MAPCHPMQTPTSARFTVLPSRVTLPASVGAKAQFLGRLTSSEFPVPRWFVVLPDAFHASAAAADPAWRRRLDDPGALREWLLALPMLPEASSEIQRLLSTFADLEGRFAVSLSSAPSGPPPGPLPERTRLFVDGTEVQRSITGLWAEAMHGWLLYNRSERRLDVLPPPPAVIVQEMVDAEVSGIATSADPSTGRRGVAKVSALWGLGPGLHCPDCEADVWHLGREGTIVSRSVVLKALAHKRSSALAETTTSTALPPTHREQPCLTDDQIQSAASLARNAEVLCGQPMEIELAWARGQVHILRARPLPSLASLPDPDGETTLWDGRSLKESFPGFTTPLTFSIARLSHAAVHKAFCRTLSVPASRLNAHDAVLGRMMGMIRGRIFHNLSSWAVICKLLPGFRASPRFIAAVLGDPLPVDTTTRQDGGGGMGSSRMDWCLDALRVGRMMFGLGWQFLTSGRRVRTLQQRLQAVLNAKGVPPALQRIDELANLYQDIERDLLLRWDAAVANDLFALLLAKVQRCLSRKWLGDLTGSLSAELLSGGRSMPSLEPARRIRTMAVLATQNAALTEAFCSGTVREIEIRLLSDPRMQSACADFLRQFGEPCLEELKLETRSLTEFPLPLYRAIGHAARRGLGPDLEDATTPHRAAAQRADRILQGHPLRRWIFRWLLRRTRLALRTREDLRLGRARLFGRLRCIFTEIGRRLAIEGRLDNPRDIFHLTVEEITGFVQGTTVTTDMRGLVSLRKQESERWTKAPPPAGQFETLGAVHIGNGFEARDSGMASPPGEVLQGIAGHPGRVRAQAQRIQRSSELNPATAGILVTESAEPGWLLRAPATAGLLLEEGNALSAAITVAQELNIPAIAGLKGLSSWVKEGDWLEMDGAAGTVRRVPAPSTSP